MLQFFDCAQNIGVGLLRGLDDTRSGFRITLVGYWLVGLPAAWALGYAAGPHTLGIWLGLLAGLAPTALLLRRYGTALRARGTCGPRGGRPSRGGRPCRTAARYCRSRGSDGNPSRFPVSSSNSAQNPPIASSRWEKDRAANKTD
ncbi:hypothetical protein SNOUR_06985 [Streptomyces noursei ATCC 11455]|nr:hypothetical protein SNOUR_06985 [Streptomyces noursei ATCC 11455]